MWKLIVIKTRRLSTMSEQKITVSLDTLPRTFPSLFVPIVPSNVSDQSIYKVINQYDLGFVKSIRRIPHRDNDRVSKLIIDLSWSDAAADIRRDLIAGETRRLTFHVRDEEEKFWVVRMYR